MDIVENLDQWQTDFEQGWLANFNKTGELNWKIYSKVNNKTAPAGPGIDLSKSRLVLISTAGGYLRHSQEPFDAPNPLGDYSIRVFPVSTPFSDIAYAHEHYDHTAVNEDPQVLLPFKHLETMVADGFIGEITPNMISYSGYHPDVREVVNTLIPAVAEAVKAEQADAALLVPA